MSIESESTISPQQRAARLVVQAYELIQVDRYDLAERLLGDALTADPSNSHAHAAMGLVHHELKRPAEAREEAYATLAIDPQNTTAFCLLGILEREAGRNQEAERLLLEGLKIDPQDTALLLNYAILMFWTNRLEKSEQLLQAALRIDPEHKRCHAFLAIVQANRRKPSSALANGLKSVQMRPDSDLSHAALGLAYMMRGRPFAARRHLREALRIDPTDADLVRMYHTADFYCRWTFLPMYYVQLLFGFIPGGQFTVWGALVLLSFLPRRNEGIPFFSIAVITWLFFCVYSWISTPLTRAWIKFFPAL